MDYVKTMAEPFASECLRGKSNNIIQWDVICC